MNGEDGSLSLVGMSFAKQDGTNYRLWAMRMTDYLQREGLWNLVNGCEELLEKPEKEESDKDKLVKEYEKNMEQYKKQDLSDAKGKWYASDGNNTCYRDSLLQRNGVDYSFKYLARRACQLSNGY